MKKLLLLAALLVAAIPAYAGDATTNGITSGQPRLDTLGGTAPLSNGGTGANLTDPNADRIMFWDDSAGQVTWLTAGSGLTITGTSISSSGGGGGTFPGSSTDNAVVRFDGAGGSTVQNSGVIVDDSNNISGIGTIAAGATVLTSASATAFAVGPNGTTNPGLQVNAATASADNGILITMGTGGVSLVNSTSDAFGDLTVGSKSGENIVFGDTTSDVKIRANGTLRQTLTGSNIVFSVLGTAKNFGTGNSPQVQVLGTSATSGAFGVGRWSNDTGASSLRGFKSRSGSEGTNTIVTSGDDILQIVALGADGTGEIPAAEILLSSNGTPGTNDMPGSIDLRVTADGAAATSSALKLSNTKNATFGGTMTAASLTTSGSTQTADLCTDGSGNFVAASVLCVASSRRFKQDIETLSPNQALSEVMKLRPVSFRYKPEFNGPKLEADANYNRRQVGFIAEEVAGVDARFSIYEPDGVTVRSVRYDQMAALLAGALQQQQQMIYGLIGGLFAAFLLIFSRRKSVA